MSVRAVGDGQGRLFPRPGHRECHRSKCSCSCPRVEMCFHFSWGQPEAGHGWATRELEVCLDKKLPNCVPKWLDRCASPPGPYEHSSRFLSLSVLGMDSLLPLSPFSISIAFPRELMISSIFSGARWPLLYETFNFILNVL